MRLLANENFPRQVVEALRAAGHDVLWARTEMAGAADPDVLARAEAEGRILVTFDKDFGELAFRSGLPAKCGIVLVRIPPYDPDDVAVRLVAILGSRTDWPGSFAVVREDRIRIRPLPTRP